MSVGGFFKTVGRVAYPFLSTAAAAGGPLTAMAASTIGKALGLDTVESNANSIADAMAKATMDPAEREKLVQAEHQFELQLRELNIKSVEALEAIAAADRDSARNREIQVRDKTPQIGFYMLLLGFFVALALLFKFPIPQDNKAIIYTMIGSLGTLTIMASTYFYGSTTGSARKTELLSQADAIDAGNATK